MQANTLTISSTRFGSRSKRPMRDCQRYSVRDEGEEHGERGSGGGGEGVAESEDSSLTTITGTRRRAVSCSGMEMMAMLCHASCENHHVCQLVQPTWQAARRKHSAFSIEHASSTLPLHGASCLQQGNPSTFNPQAVSACCCCQSTGTRACPATQVIRLPAVSPTIGPHSPSLHPPWPQRRTGG